MDDGARERIDPQKLGEVGLSLSYDTVVHQHAGSLRVESEEGSFTEFILVLPRHPGSSREPVT